MKRKVFQIGGIIALMITMTACGNKAQAETMEPTTVVETTMQETTAEPTTEESTAEPTEGSYSGQRANGDAFVKLDLPTLSTGKEFGELEAMTYEIVYSQWEQTSEEDKGYIGREGLKENIKMIEGLSEQEIDEVADHILSKLPIPVTEVSKQESKPASQPTQSNNSNNETKAVPKETQASVQPTQPEVQPTQSQQSESALPPEVQAEIDRRAAERAKEVQDYKDSHGGKWGNDASGGEAAGAIEGDINLNGF